MRKGNFKYKYIIPYYPAFTFSTYLTVITYPLTSCGALGDGLGLVQDNVTVLEVKDITRGREGGSVGAEINKNVINVNVNVTDIIPLCRFKRLSPLSLFSLKNQNIIYDEIRPTPPL